MRKGSVATGATVPALRDASSHPARSRISPFFLAVAFEHSWRRRRLSRTRCTGGDDGNTELRRAAAAYAIKDHGLA